jgi:hypothetical protein
MSTCAPADCVFVAADEAAVISAESVTLKQGLLHLCGWQQLHAGQHQQQQ